MGTISKGILGGFSGTVGTVIGGSWRGIEYMRSRPGRRTTASSQKQKEQQAKFALMVKFQQPFNDLLKYTFGSYAIRMTGPNSALSYNLRNAVAGTYPDYEVNYSMFLLSRGDLPNALNPAATAGAAGEVNFAWTNNSGTGKAMATDTAMVVIHCPELNQSIYAVGEATRADGELTMEVSNYSGKTVQTWIAFFSETGKDIATSIYTGEVIVT